MKLLLTALALFVGVSSVTADDDWKPVEGHITTRWAEEVDPQMPWPEYPRPQMVRKQWLNLNGLWEYLIEPKNPFNDLANRGHDVKWDGKILVPYCVESALSGVKKPLGPENQLWYRRNFTVPDEWRDQRVLLHFGAVDWECIVWVNGKKAGSHRGGYDPFSFDITDLLHDGDNQLTVFVWDPTDAGTQPRGKQVRNPRGIWYNPVSGIWQTVWLEPVPSASIARIKNVPDVDERLLRVTVVGREVNSSHSVRITASDQEGKTVAIATGAVDEAIELTIDNPKLWSPESPNLYDLSVELLSGDTVADRVESYFATRNISLAKDDNGVLRMMLNGEPVFHYGPLDQGWWPDGLYTAPTDEALAYDLKVLKQLGMNMLRKHVKIEPERLYYHCDRLGLLVWQDMPSGGAEKSDESKKQFRVELQRMIDFLHNYPCIVMWVPFNEGWGQHDTPEISQWVKQYDPSRLVNEASGWRDQGSGDIKDVHSYPGPKMPPLEENRAAVLGEFGGLGLPVAGHLWWNKRNWGYRDYKSRKELQHHYDNLIHRLRPMVLNGLCAAVYTQTTDCEGEVNGLMTYDRAVVKLDAEHAADLHACLYDLEKPLPAVTPPPPPPKVTVLLPSSKTEGQEWRYTTDKPAEGWVDSDFDDSSWHTGKGMFGTAGTPGVRVGTVWNSADIYLRKSFELETVPDDFVLRIFHDEDAQVYINGKLVKKFPGYLTQHQDVPVGRGEDSLKKGNNTIAVHCHQTTGGQGIDVGIVVIEQP